MAKNYLFNTEHEKYLIGCCFRNLERVFDIEDKYPSFVDKNCEKVFLWLKERIEKDKIKNADDLETFVLKQKKGKTAEQRNFNIFLDEIRNFTPTDGVFDHRLKKALLEKAILETYRENLNLSKNIFKTPNLSQTISQQIESLEKIRDSIEPDVPISDDKKNKDDLSFPIDIMEGIAGDFATLYNEYLEGAKEFFYISFLTCLGSVFANKVILGSELKTQPRLYTLLIGQSADARKSTILDKTVEIFKDAMDGFSTTWGINSAEGLAKLFSKKESNTPILAIFDEFKTFISKCKIDNSVLLPMTTSFFESNIYEAHTKRLDITIKDAHLSILAASTINTFERMWSPAFLNIGFLNRIFIIPGDSEKKFSIPQKIDDGLKQSIKDVLRDIAKYIKTNRGSNDKFILPINKNAQEIYHQWYMNLDRSEYTKRLDALSLRFMILLAINVQKTSIDTGIVKKVIKLMNWQYKVRKAYDPIDADNSMAKMEQSIRRCLLKKNCLKDWELKQATGANRQGLWIYSNALKNLVIHKEIKLSKKKWILIEQKQKN